MQKHYVVTGASSGIGEAIAAALVAGGGSVLGIGRRKAPLAALEGRHGSAFSGRCLDLTDDGQVEALATALAREPGRIDGLVLCAGLLHPGNLLASPVSDLDDMYRSNLRAPFILIRNLVPLLKAAQGYLVIVNSSAGLAVRPGGGGHAVIQHALRALADTLRLELNEHGVRVLSIYPGRTATPRMDRLFAHEGRDFSPELLLQPSEVAAVVAQALAMPAGAELTDVSLRPAARSY